ncbi:MAG: putative quinol monooxygenase [Planctomycetota bacterium]|jgi:quinol monooxygenase YgiN|nr:putative quinol monooxygenase [Planctomycetota bacterium]
MIHVVATITCHPGKRDEVLGHMRANLPNVVAEDGCERYEPSVDVELGHPAQPPLRPDVIVVVETWHSLAHLLAHLSAPHMATYREQVKDLVAGAELRVLSAD